MDGFAAKHNRQVSSFISRHEDFFVQEDLGHENLWLNPPFRMILQLLAHLKWKRWDATIVVPYKPDAPWWPILIEMLIDKPIVINVRDQVFERFGRETIGKTPWDQTIIARIGARGGYKLEDNWLYTCDSKLFTVQPEVNTVRRSRRIQKTQAVELGEEIIMDNEQTQQKPMAVDKNNIGIVRETILDDDDDDNANVINDFIQQLPKSNNQKLTRVQRKAIVYEYHMYTHSNAEALIRMLKFVGKFDWSDLRELILEVDNECRDCETQKTAPTGFHPLHSIRAEFPGDIWTIDLLFFDQYAANDGSKVILHIVDNFSSFSILRVLPNKEAITVAKSLNSIMNEHGQPRLMIHDNGGEFCNATADKVFKSLREITVRRGLPYRPQTQGINERKHRKIKELLRGGLHKYTHHWPDAVSIVQAQLNTALTRRHNSTPFAIYFGRAAHHVATSTEHWSELTWYERLALLGGVVNPQMKETMDKYFNDEDYL